MIYYCIYRWERVKWLNLILDTNGPNERSAMTFVQKHYLHFTEITPSKMSQSYCLWMFNYKNSYIL